MFSPNMAASNDTCRIEDQAAPAAPLLLEGGSRKPRAKRRLITQSGEETKGESQQTGREPDTAIGKAKKSSGAAGTNAQPVAVESALAPKRATRGGQEQRRAEEEPPDEVLLPASDSEDYAECIPPEPPNTASAGETPAAPRAPVVVKLSNPKVIQAHATRFPVPQARPPRQGAWASPIERPSSSRESVAELLKGTADVAEYSEVPMTPSRVPVRSWCGVAANAGRMLSEEATVAFRQVGCCTSCFVVCEGSLAHARGRRDLRSSHTACGNGVACRTKKSSTDRGTIGGAGRKLR